MKTIKNHYRTILLCCVLIGAFVLAGLAIKPAQASQNSTWLQQFQNRVVEVTFTTVPPGRSRTERVQLVSAEAVGITIRYSSPNVIFYPYSSILSIDP